MSTRKAPKTTSQASKNNKNNVGNGMKLARELLGLILLFFGLYLFLSLISFDSRDPGFNHAISTAKNVHNSAGVIGCYLAGLLTDIFGIAAYIWPIFFLILALRQLFFQCSVQWWRVLGFICLLLCLMGASSAWEYSLGDIVGGGFIGDTLYGFLWKFLSGTGTLLLGICFFLISLQLMFNISWLALLCASWLWIVSRLAYARYTDSPPDSSPDSHPDDSGPTRSAQKKADETREIAKTSASPSSPSGAASSSIACDTKGASKEKSRALTAEKKDLQEQRLEKHHIKKDEEQAVTQNTVSAQTYKNEGNFSHEENSEGPNPFAAPWARASDIQAAWANGQDAETMPNTFNTDEVHHTPRALPKSTPEIVMPESIMPVVSSPAASAQDAIADDFIVDSLPRDDQEENFVAENIENDAIVAPDDVIDLDATMAVSPNTPSNAREAHDFVVHENLTNDITENISEDITDDFTFDEGHDVTETSFHGLSEAPDIFPSSEAPLYNDRSTQEGVQESGQEEVHGIPSFEVLMDADKDGITDLTEEEVGIGGAAKAAPIKIKTRLPHVDLLQDITEDEHAKPRLDILTEKGERLTTCLADFGIQGELTRITPGPVVTMFEFRPAPGIKVSRIANLSDDLSLALKAIAVRIQAPIPGKDTVGIEIPNEMRETVYFKELLASQTFHDASSLLTIAVGKDSAGRPSVADLAKMPHLLVAGATGAGKSVCLNSILLSFLYKARPEDVQLLLIDPKRIELAVYADLPHLVHPVVTDMSHAKNALDWAVHEMDRRYEGMARLGVRNIAGYNQKLEAYGNEKPIEILDLEFMPYLVIIIDELADLMLTAAKEVETSIVRLAQLARAAGIHMVLATQRPSVDVVTGIIKANFPCRISFQVTSKHDSRTILDTVGAEHLLGRGDMLFKPSGGRLQRLHGAFVSDDEVCNVVEFWKRQQAPMYRVDFAEWGNEVTQDSLSGSADALADDPMYHDAVEFVMSQGRASISLVQRRFRIGFNKAARYVEQMEQDGIIGPADGSKPRLVIKGRDI